MIGYIFRTTNKKTGKVYLGKRYAVSFDKKYLGDDVNEELAVDVEKYGRPSFDVKMIWPYESKEQLDAAFENMSAESKPEPEEKVVISEEVIEEKPKTRKRRSKAIEE